MGFGDEIMVSGRARVAQLTDPRKVRVVIDRSNQWHEAWDNNPRVARPEEVGDFQNLVARVNRLRPYIEAKTSKQWTWLSYKPPVGELYFSQQELDFGALYAGRIVIEPNNKPGANPNKDWGWQRWAMLTKLILGRGLVPTQLGPAGVRVMPGVEHIETRSMRLAAAVIANARAAVLPEGGLHHVAAAVGCPAVVIFGGFISPEVTGYQGAVNLFERKLPYPLGCGWRVQCEHCAEAMGKMTPALVMGKLEGLLEKLPRRVPA